ncbi:MAG: transposase [Candidatus Parcubacteria bacterium]|nr:transposase [Candidatus Parcubacteria bacterium]
MSELFHNKFRIASTRLQDWDYGWPGLYYVTICTENRVCCLAEIKDELVYLTEIGKIVFECWLEITKHFDNTILDDWIIMPNHLHGIIGIKENDFGSGNCRDARSRVSTVNKFGPLQPKSLPVIIHAFKSSVKRYCNKNDLAGFFWQPRYYEHIIKDEDDYARIKEYIAYNPIRWEFDRNNLININK